MPIGFDAGDGRADSSRGGSDPLTPTPPGYDPTPEQSRAQLDQLVPVVVERWMTQEDERVCPVCGPLDQLELEQTQGPYPPLHRNCRCYRTFAYVYYSSRAGG